jgi:CelD/BcsL family acetyltransferase involved in cellulose biosynthesis
MAASFLHKNNTGCSALNVELVASFAELRDVVPAWDVLARNSLEANPFYESWALLPAVEHLADNNVAVLLVWQDASHARLIGLFPLMREYAYRKFPVCHWSNWLHPHCPLGTPLLHREYARQALDGLFDWLHGASGATVFSFNKVATDGVFFAGLQEILREQGRFLDTSDRWERALLNTSQGAEDYLRTHQRKKKFKEFARLRRRLGETGDLRFDALLPGEVHDLDHWIRDFLRLEESGWKGRQQSAMSSQQQERLFAEDLIRKAAAYGQLMMLRMRLDGETIAIKLNLTGAAQGVFTFKIAYDERYAQYSPGVLLEVENMHRVLDDLRLGWVDSCTTPQHPLFDHLWVERRKMASLHVSTGHPFSKPLMHTLRMVKSVYRYCRMPRT